MSISVFIVIVILAVAAGYTGTKYVVYPFLLDSSAHADHLTESQNDAETASESGIDTIASMPSVILDQQNVQNIKEEEDTKTTSSDSTAVAGSGPYCVQFGSFSAKEGAETLSKELSAKGIYSFVVEDGDSQKVLGLPYTTKEKASEAAAIVSAEVTDVFVVDLSTIMHQ